MARHAITCAGVLPCLRHQCKTCACLICTVPSLRRSIFLPVATLSPKSHVIIIDACPTLTKVPYERKSRALHHHA
ncbi:hypothetical protein BU23DRAFT_323894 [Bimuria novae-zelandiae CBS 107.79]|uniref:Uncharacterized protein n=1 Tax=Bimuria novae-zelandiae CBS 107.79 TaxID=1447943 RepID=A0A6A5VI46_9PLEO|nr:hypothetical protein BU23DRAFT_323894 [Bimuria novae-zelandiae CBS 107.79]